MRFLPWWVSASRTQRSLFARHRVRQPGHFSVVADEPAEWSVFDPDQVWLGCVTIPRGLEVYEIGSDYILWRATDEMEVERILVFELVKDLA
jgi:hypothetical protein